ncbi:MAG TPA: beta-propeller fold lactonase family protein [Candidatus Acidoferrales bacterium]|nr:beta-propeller fold lactonase family protein [Candidatus Acidoferrales bacterium]
MLKKATALFLVCTALAVSLSCGKVGNHYLYAAIPQSSEILVYREDPNSGALTPLSSSPFTAGPEVQSLVIHPSKQFLYAANPSENDISLFLIAADGSITEQTPRTSVTPLGGITPFVLVMDPTGSYLYVANAESNNILVFSIDSSGNLNAVGTPVQLGLTPLNMMLSANGNFLYVTGTISQGYVEVFSVNAGVLSFVQSQLTGDNPYGLAIAVESSSSSFLYTANFTDNSISEFSIDSSSGELTELANSPLGETYTSPVFLLVDNSEKYLYVANEGSGNLTAYSIASDGGLALLSNSPFSANAQPSVIAIDPSGQYLFVGNQKSAAIESFSLAVSSGSLSEVGSYSVGSTPTSIAVIP